MPVYMRSEISRLAAGGSILTLLLLFSISCSGGENKNSRTSAAGNPTELRLITHNVWFGFTRVPDRKEDWMEWMQRRRPDVVALQELNEYTPEQLAEDANRWGHSYTALLKTEGFPTGITSRYPLTDVKRLLNGFHHGLLRAKIEGVYFYVIHLHPGDRDTRYREAGLILQDIDGLPADAPVVLAGDFNALSPLDSARYAGTSLEAFFRQRDRNPELTDHNLNNNRLDYSVIRRFLDAGFIDLTHRFRPEVYNFTGTFPTSIEKEGDHGDYRRLDYVFANESLSGKITNAAVVSNDTTRYLSDHLPVVVDFRFE